MKKNHYSLVTVLIMCVMLLSGCGEENGDLVQQFKDGLDEQSQMVNGKDVDEAVADVLDEISDEINKDETESDDSSSVDNSQTNSSGDKIELAIGETKNLQFLDGISEGASIDVTITEWGTVVDDLQGELVYIHYGIKNVSDITCNVGNSMFDVYADNYMVEQIIPASINTYLTNATLSAGRQAEGDIFLNIDPEAVSNIEVECGPAVWIIKKPTEVITKSDIPEGIIKGEEPMDSIVLAGRYETDFGDVAELNMYSSFETEAVGNASVSINGSTISGELIPIDTNVYQIITSDGTVALLGVSSEESQPCLDLYIDGNHIEYYHLVEQYIS